MTGKPGGNVAWELWKDFHKCGRPEVPPPNVRVMLFLVHVSTCHICHIRREI